MKRNRRISNRWSVFKENHSTGHICVMIVLVNVAFIIASSLLISVLPENKGKTLGEVLRLAFTLMVNPSGKYIYSEAPISLILTTIVVLLGMISLTGGTVGFITSFINGFLEKTANSKRSLKLRDHIVILNFNQRVPSILCDYCFDDMKSTYIVILTDQDKDTVNARIDEMYNQLGMKQRFRNVIVRSGNPMSRLDLERIAIAEASTVLLMAPEKLSASETNFAVSKLFLLVTSFLKEIKAEQNTDIIVETGSDDMAAMVREYNLTDSSSTVVSVEYNQIIGKLLGVTAIMPSVNDVLRQLFSFEGVELYTLPIPNTDIATELRTTRSVLPVFDINGRRAYIAESEEEFGKQGSAPSGLSKPLPKRPLIPKLAFSKTEIVIVGINSKLNYILESLSCFRREYDNDELHVILADTADRAEELSAYYSDPTYAGILQPERYSPIIISNIYRPMDELRDIVNNSADTILFLSDESADSTLVDEKPLLYWSDTQNKMTSGAHADIVVELRNSENKSIIQCRDRDQILVSDDFLGHLYAQLGKNPLRLDIIMDLITSEGDSASVTQDNESQNAGDLLCLRAGSIFGSSTPELTFASKRELILWFYEATGHRLLPIGCVKDGTTCLFSRTDGNDDSLDSCVLLGINEGQRVSGPSDRLTLAPDDELVAFMMS